MRATLLRADRDQLRLVLACLVVESHDHHAKRRRPGRLGAIYRDDDARIALARRHDGEAAVADCATPRVVPRDARDLLATAVDEIEAHGVVREARVRVRKAG